MNWNGWLAKFALKIPEVIGAWLRTASANGQANLGENVRVFREGGIINIFGDPSHLHVGPNSRIRGEIMTYAHAGKIDIGSWFYLGPGSMIWSSDDTGIRIGDRVLISANVMIHDTNSHPMHPEARFEQTRAIFTKGHPKEISGIRSSPITIGDDVWVGAGVIILKGVTIGEGAIVGAGSVVTRDVPAHSVVAGNPARVVRQRVLAQAQDTEGST